MIPKFRAWEKIHNYMFEPFALVFNENGSIEIDDGHDMLDIKYVKLMQSTGYVDIHGEEIYEGDIVLLEGHVVCVYWENKKGMFMLKDNKYITTTLEGCNNLTIIGNIYENKELLENDTKI